MTRDQIFWSTIVMWAIGLAFAVVGLFYGIPAPLVLAGYFAFVGLMAATFWKK